ncbi:class I SAM-dependent methyltransferase [Patescibacteria group bacterium]|nr:class I SAM-dependent methyltransferase [Patescibacteria group bacterium]
MPTRVETSGRQIPPENWDRYMSSLRGSRRTLTRILVPGTDTSYDTFTAMPLYKETWQITKQLFNGTQPGGSVLDLGCGDGHLALSVIQATDTTRFVGLDISEAGLATARARVLGRNNLDVQFYQQDLAQPWTCLDGQQFDTIFSSNVLGWLPPQARQAIFPQIAKHLAPEGQAILQIRTGWKPDTIKAHVVDEAKSNLRVCLATLFASKQDVDAMNALSQTGLSDACTPDREELEALIRNNGLKIVDAKPTFWPKNEDDPWSGKGIAMRLSLAD